MSTLDIVLQRQVPVRSAAKMGGDAVGADAAGGRADEAFSSVLSGHKGNAAAARDQIDQKTDPDPAAGAEADTPDTAASNANAHSDEMLSLLEGLMSSAAFSDETQLGAGKAETAELEAPANGETIVPDATVDETITVLPGAEQALTERIAVKTPDATEPSANAGAQQEPGPSQVATDLDPVKTTTALAAAGQVASAAASVAASQSSGSGRAGQGAQEPARPQPTAAATNQGKASGEDKEIIRSLGMVDEPSAGSGSRNAAADDRFAGSGRKSATVARPAEEPVSAKLGSVEVMESRRFMPAQPLTGNAQMVTRSLIEAGDAALAAQRTAPSQAAAAAQPQSGQMLHTLKLQLNPVSLGSVTAVLKLTGEELSVSIQVETAEAYRQLSDNNQSILKAMRAQGYAVEQITVQHVPSADRSGNAAQQQGFQGNFQGSGSGDAQSSGRGNDGRSTGHQGADQHGGQGREQNSYSGSGRSDGVYL